MSDPSPFPSSALSDLEPAVREIVEDELGPPGGRTGTISVWLGDVDGGVHVAVEAGVQHYAASTMKLPLLVAAYRQHQLGALDLDDDVEVRNEFVSAAGGSTYSLDAGEDQDPATWAQLGSRCSLRTLVERAVTVSGNLAANLVLERVGPAAVAAVLADAGCSAETRLPRGIEDLAAHAAGIDNLVTAADLGVLLRGVAARSLADPATCREIEAVLSRQTHLDGIPAGLPAGTPVANKTGWVTGISHDAAVVRPERRPAYVLVVLTTLDLPEEEAAGLISDLSAVLWEGWHR